MAYKYKYYSTQRPIVPGGYPKNEFVQEITNFDEKQLIPAIGKRAWGFIEYSYPLTAKQIADYELTPATFYEDKQQICNALALAIQKTRGGNDLSSLEYDPDTERVTAYFMGGGWREINVAADSGFAMIKDIINHLEI